MPQTSSNVAELNTSYAFRLLASSIFTFSVLSMTSEACKTLYNGNVALQSKHQALLARLPAGQPMTPSSSNTPVSSAAPSPHFYTSNLPRDRTSSIVSVEPPVPPRHFRRISVSPSDIAQLADQNAELMQTLQELEAESSHADQAGKRKLKRLEEEIQILRGGVGGSADSERGAGAAGHRGD